MEVTTTNEIYTEKIVGSIRCVIEADYHTDEKGLNFLERTMKFESKYQENENSSQVSMFGEASTVQFSEPDIPECETWGTMELLSQEKEVIGI